LAFNNFAPNGEWRFGGRAAIRFEPRLLTNSIESAIDAAVAGLGITRALCYQVSGPVEEGRLTTLLPDEEPPPVPITLLFQANRQRSPNVRAFIDLAGQRLRESQLR
jgi:DNA-binding transcriptional LysR family regulator